MTPIFHINNHA